MSNSDFIAQPRRRTRLGDWADKPEAVGFHSPTAGDVVWRDQRPHVPKVAVSGRPRKDLCNGGSRGTAPCGGGCDPISQHGAAGSRFNVLKTYHADHHACLVTNDEVIATPGTVVRAALANPLRGVQDGVA